MNEVDIIKCSEEEKYFYNRIISQTLKETSYKNVYPQHIFIESTGRQRKIDFAIITNNTKIAIELDGYTYHAREKVGRDKFDDDLQRQNELILDNWKVIRFSWDQVQKNPETCKDYLRRLIVSDPELHPSLNCVIFEPHILQIEALNLLQESREKGNKKGLIVMATGLGKTYLSAFDSNRFEGRVLFIVHNNSILEQARESFLKVAPQRLSGFFNGYEKQPEKNLLFANINTLGNDNYLAKFNNDEFDYIIIDEFHHSATQRYKKAIDYFRPKFLLGMTATPNRTDKKSILYLVDNNLVYQVTQLEAIERGFLTPFYYYALKDNVDYSNIRHNGYRYNLYDLNKALIIKKRDEEIIKKYKEMTNCAKAIAFCVTIDHAKRAAEHFNEAGIPSIAIHSGLSNEERINHISDFRQNKYKVVFVRDIFNEGIDFPDVEALLFMRPTESKIIFTQQLGRGLRLSNSKSAVKILDYIGNYVNADKIVEYLSSYGKTLTLNDLKMKPLFYFDNGCRVEFEQSSIDMLTALNINIPSEDSLLKAFFELCIKLRRTPTMPEIQSQCKYKIKNYLEKYITWNNFIERIRTLNSEIDTTNLQVTRELSLEKAEEYAELLDHDFAEFKEEIIQCLDAVNSVKDKFINIGHNLTQNESRDSLQGILEVIDNPIIRLKEITLILSLRFEKPDKILLGEPDIGEDKNKLLLESLEFDNKAISDYSELVAINLRSFCNSSLAYTFPRGFIRIIHLAQQYSFLIKQIDENECDVLSNLYMIAIQMLRLLVEAKSDIDKMLELSC
ncbi:MAG: DEAD/DEAH box helicase [Nitrospirae bacterium]|nr:DEAD/DEAH box helicase [Nitrospirota bacterium]